MRQHAAHQLDFYKTGHPDQFPKNTTEVYSNLTARSGKLSNVPNSKGVVFFGMQLLIMEFLIDEWNDTFFKIDKDEAIGRYKNRVSTALGYDVKVNRLSALHDLGYLPVLIKAMPEGAFVPYKIPLFTIQSTLDDFYWVTNMLESVISSELWQPITSATTFREYRLVFEKFADETCEDRSFVPFQGHDFSMRGMAGRQAAAKSAAAVIAAGSKGTDTVSGIDIMIDYYGADDTEFIAGSINATEHAVMCAGGKESEIDTYLRLLVDVYPTGKLSIVSDTWDFWKVVGETLVTLKDTIMNRDGQLVIRPDSGDPVQIICGRQGVMDFTQDIDIVTQEDALQAVCDEVVSRYGQSSPNILSTHEYFKFSDKYFKVKMSFSTGLDGTTKAAHVEDLEEVENTCEEKGLVESLYDIFGGEINNKGFKVLDEHIGAIYGDSITLDRQTQILTRLRDKGFASSNIVLGLGSFSFQFTTRDTHGMAMKATSVIVDGERSAIFKDPKTDDGTKKSARGLLMVTRVGNTFQLKDDCTLAESKRGVLEPVFKNGRQLTFVTLQDILDESLRTD